jgi:hypothetical protein
MGTKMKKDGGGRAGGRRYAAGGWERKRKRERERTWAPRHPARSGRNAEPSQRRPPVSSPPYAALLQVVQRRAFKPPFRTRTVWLADPRHRRLRFASSRAAKLWAPQFAALNHLALPSCPAHTAASIVCWPFFDFSMPRKLLNTLFFPGFGPFVAFFFAPPDASRAFLLLRAPTVSQIEGAQYLAGAGTHRLFRSSQPLQRENEAPGDTVLE